MYKVLLIEDDVEYCDLLREYLTPDGFELEAVHNGQHALSYAGSKDYDIIILDVMLPGLNGIEVLRKLREEVSTPVLMLTARGDEVDRIIGLEMGADDYLAKPCNPRELLARLKAILRRIEKSDELGVTQDIDVDNIRLNSSEHQAYLNGQELILTLAEYKVLEVLLRHVGQVVTKEVLTKRALSRNMTQYDRSIDVHISKLRTKLSRQGDGQSPIKTVRGIGYRYVSNNG